MYIDTHCHLNSEEMLSDVELHLKEANEAGVNTFIVIGCDKTSSFLAVELAKKYQNIYAAVGFFPCDVKNATESDLDDVITLLKEPKVVAVGEIGLDYYWEKDENEKVIQREWFKKQILIANAYNKPIIIHNRDAFSDCLSILKEFAPKESGVMHCSSGSIEYLKEVLDLGLYIGLDGPVTYKNAKTPKEVAKIVPLDRVLLETDSPYLTPHPFRGKPNSPKYLPLIAEEIAALRNVDVSLIEESTSKNAKKLFKI